MCCVFLHTSVCVKIRHYKDTRCPYNDATTLLDCQPQGGGSGERRMRSLRLFCFFSVMVVAVIMLSFILSRTFCQTFAIASCKPYPYPTLVTTLRAFTTSGPKCGEDFCEGKTITINVNAQVKSKVHGPVC